MPTISRPGLRRVVLVGIHQALSDEREVWDSRFTDEVPTLILPAIGTQYITGRTLKLHQAVSAGVESHLAPIYKLVKTSGIYALASMAPPFLSLVLAPFLTHHLSPTDFGILAILNTLISLGVGITQLGLSSAFFRA